ncbi:MAG: site-2 protease family protein, partial [Pseudomonadota bacterium]
STPPWLAIQDHYTGDVRRQWQHHRDTVNAASQQAPVRPALTPQENVEHSIRFSERHHQWLESQGILKRDGNELRFTLRSAWRYLRESQSGTARAKQTALRTGKTALGPLNERLVVDTDLKGYRRFVALSQPAPMGLVAKIALFLVSAFAFAGVFGLAFTPSFGLALLAVIGIHEFGHALAMKAFGYRDLGVFFIPMFGGLAHGKKDNPTVFEKTIVSLAGPVPGLVIGIVLLDVLGYESGFGFSVGILFVLVNYLNLLPFLPLDGGRIVEETLTARSRGLRVAFSGLSILGLAAIAVWLKEPVLVLLALFMGLGFANHYGTWKALRDLSADELRELEDHHAARTVLQRLSAGRKFDPAVRYGAARDVLERRGLRTPNAAALVFCTLLYLGAIVTPWFVSPSLVTFAQYLAGTSDTPSNGGIEARLTEAQSPEEKIYVLLEAASQRPQADGGMALLARAVELIDEHGLRSDNAVEVLMTYADDLKDDHHARAVLFANRGVELAADLHGDDSTEVAFALADFADILAASESPDWDRAHDTVGQALTIFSGAEDMFGMSRALDVRADLHEQRGALDLAEADLKASAASLSTDNNMSWLASDQHLELAEFYGRHGNFAAAADAT